VDSCLDAFLYSEPGLTLIFLEVVDGSDPYFGKHRDIITVDDSTTAEVRAPSLGITVTTSGMRRSNDQFSDEKGINN